MTIYLLVLPTHLLEAGNTSPPVTTASSLHHNHLKNRQETPFLEPNCGSHTRNHTQNL
uniref:Uncharacterized protein n=1 Tax=Rhizophora mucronata TaxID=61149 RepID=A0A2P2ISW6_RHIMU